MSNLSHPAALTPSRVLQRGPSLPFSGLPVGAGEPSIGRSCRARASICIRLLVGRWLQALPRSQVRWRRHTCWPCT